MSQIPHQVEHVATFTDLYASGDHAEKNPMRHLEESPWKAEQLLHMPRRHALKPATIAEVGCGAGKDLIAGTQQKRIGFPCELASYDISPNALPYTAGLRAVDNRDLEEAGALAAKGPLRPGSGVEWTARLLSGVSLVALAQGAVRSWQISGNSAKMPQAAKHSMVRAPNGAPPVAVPGCCHAA